MLKLEMPTLKEVVEEVSGNEKRLKELLDKFRLWLKQQVHLPQDISDQRLIFLICTAKFDLERAKTRLDSHYTLRNLLPEIYANFDPLSDSITQIHKYAQFIPMPKLTPEKYRLYIARFINSDSSTFDLWACIRYIVLQFETRIEEDMAISNIILLDNANLRIGHVLKLTPTMFKKCNTCLESYGVRIKGIHIINVPSFYDIVISMAKAMIKAKLFDRIHLYTSGIESLYGIIPKFILPADYGGEQPSMDTLADMWNAKLVERREWFLQQEKVTANETLRSNSIINPDDLFGVSGRFRKLDID